MHKVLLWSVIKPGRQVRWLAESLLSREVELGVELH